MQTDLLFVVFTFFFFVVSNVFLISPLFLGLLSFLEAEKMPPNFPECKVMSTAASQLKKNIETALRKDAVCQRNIHCTGTV